MRRTLASYESAAWLAALLAVVSPACAELISADFEGKRLAPDVCGHADAPTGQGGGAAQGGMGHAGADAGGAGGAGTAAR